MLAEQHPHMTVRQYLDMDRVAERKHEYVDGLAYAMAGGSRTHGRLGVRVGRILDSALEGTACRVYSSDVRVRIHRARYFYPDASVSCDDRDLGPGDILRFPRVAVEVLSRSTETYDRGRKFEMYQTCPTLQEYVLVSQREPSIEVQRRSCDVWQRHAFGLGEDVELSSVELKFAVATLYAGIELVDV